MHLPIIPERALLALADTLALQVRPDVCDPQALDQLNAAIGVVLRLAIELGGEALPQADADKANARSQLIADAVSGGAPATALEAALAEELAAVDERDRLFRALRERSVEAAPQFPLPSAAEILTVLSGRFGDADGAEIANLRPILGGNSKQSVLFDLVPPSGEALPMVLRRDLPQSSNGKTVADEAPLLLALRQVGFPAPDLVHSEPVSEGRTALLVMRRNPGRPLGDHEGPSADADGDPLRMLAGTLAQLHAIDVDALGLPGYSDVVCDAGNLRAAVTAIRARDQAHWDAREPILELAFAWLEANAADAVDRKVIVHGDYGFHNLMSHEGQALLLDWEMAHPGSAAEDLNRARDCLAGLTSFEDFLDLYETLGGRRPEAHVLRYYDVLRLVRSTVNYRAAVALFNSGVNNSIRKLNATATLYVRNLAAIARLVVWHRAGLA